MMSDAAAETMRERRAAQWSAIANREIQGGPMSATYDRELTRADECNVSGWIILGVGRGTLCVLCWQPFYGEPTTREPGTAHVTCEMYWRSGDIAAPASRYTPRVADACGHAYYPQWYGYDGVECAEPRPCPKHALTPPR